MANSAMNREEKTRRVRRGASFAPLFMKAMDGVIKDYAKLENSKKLLLEQYKPGSCSEDLNDSKKSPDELAADPVKQSKSCQEKILPLNDKANESSKLFSNSRQSVDQNDDTPHCSTWTSRNSKSHNSSNNSNKYFMNAGHGDSNCEKFSGLPKSDFSYKSNDTFDANSFIKTFKPNSKHPESSNTYQKKILPTNDEYSENHVKSALNSRKYDDQMPRYSRSYSTPNNSSNYHQSSKPDYLNEKSHKLNSSSLNSNSHHIHTTGMNNFNSQSSKEFNSSNISPKKSDKHCSDFKRNCNFQMPYSYNNPKENNFHSSQYRGSYKSSSNRNHPRYNSNSDSYNIKPSYKFDQNIKMQDDVKENSFFDENLNSASDSQDKNTEIKHHRLLSELDDTITINKETVNNLKITLKNVPDTFPDPSISSSPSISYVSNAPISETLSVSILSVSSTPISPVLNISPGSVISNVSPVFSPASTLESISTSSLSNVFDDPSVNNDSIKMLISSDDNFIPPPTSCDSPGASDKLLSTVEKNVTFLQKNGSESTEVGSYEDEACFSLPDSEHLEAISKFISNVVKERSVSCPVAITVVRDLNTLFKTNFEGNVIDYYGSYYTELAITTSDINLMIKADVSLRKSFMYEIHKVLSKELEKYRVLQYEEGSTTHKCKINFVHTSTGVNCELAYLGSKPDKILNMGKFLNAMCCKDRRVRPLIIATKIWAEHCNINEAENEKLHPIGFTLLVIHFLQHCENPILPIYSPERQDIDDLPRNDACIGELWLGFFWYFSYVFNWQEDILTVTSVDRVSKKSKKWENYWIAIEDPFTEKNIALSVTNKDVADRIKTCFKQTYNYFLNGPQSFLYDEDDEDQNSTSQFEFSFNDCILEQDEDICEMCEEIDDVCDECKKKIYVQPMASVPKMTDDFLKVIRRALLTVNKKYMLTDDEVDERRQFVSKLENYVHKLYPDAKMNLFGSSANGFAFKKSDLDVNLTFESKKEHKVILANLCRHLRRNPDFANVIAIFNANIPVLKFRYKPQGWRGDISLDNVLAIHNSELLYTYTLLDKRCKILGCALKLIAKKALIVEATEKALSSYSYAIMVIHFLQQTDPPVLPVLQDVQFRDNYELGHVVDNCNVWFCQDIDYIKKIFKAENDTNVEQLFLDLLDYYCSFDCNNIITIRQKEIVPLASCEKMRSARLFNIQDPFLVDKNLGCCVSQTKAQEIKSVFNRARMLFRIPKKELHTDNLEDYFFSTMSLTGRIQKEVLCDLCGKFGHSEKDCRNTFTLKNNFKPFTRNKFFKPFQRKDQYANQNDFRRNQNLFKMNNQRYMEKL